MQPYTLARLIAATRRHIDDSTLQPRVSDTDIADDLNEAESEAAVRAKLIRDDTTDSITLLQFLTDAHTVTLDASIFEVARVINSDTGDEILPVTEEQLYVRGRWQSEEGNTPEGYLIKLLPNEQLQFRLFPIYTGTDPINIRLEVFRTPLLPMEDEDDEPEIGAVNHMALIFWAAWRAWTVRDPDIESPADADRALAAFEGFFGQRDTAQQRRLKRSKQHTGVARARAF